MYSVRARTRARVCVCVCARATTYCVFDAGAGGVRDAPHRGGDQGVAASHLLCHTYCNIGMLSYVVLRCHSGMLSYVVL